MLVSKVVLLATCATIASCLPVSQQSKTELKNESEVEQRPRSIYESLNRFEGILNEEMRIIVKMENSIKERIQNENRIADEYVRVSQHYLISRKTIWILFVATLAFQLIMMCIICRQVQEKNQRKKGSIQFI